MNDRLASLLAKAGAKPADIIAVHAQPTMTLDDQRTNVAEWARRDPAHVCRLIELIGRDFVVAAMAEKRAEIGEAMPARSAITAGQCSLFDNWGSSKRPNKNKREKNAGAPRYQCTIELWTLPTGTPLRSRVNSAFQATGALLDKAELTKRLKSLHEAKGRPWRARSEQDTVGADLAAFGDRLMALYDAHPGVLWGPMFTTVGFTRYFLGHYVGADAATIGTKGAKVIVRQEGDAEISFERFATTFSNGAALPACLIGHSRISKRPEDSI